MTGLPEQFVDVVNEDRFCNSCGENLRNAFIEREPHYGMHLVTCPQCGTPEQVERRPLARTGQRWAGLALAMWFIALLGLWAGTNFALMGMSLGVAEESRWMLAEYIEQAYENDHPEDSGGSYRTSVQFVQRNMPGLPTPTGQPSTTSSTAGQNPSVQVFPAGPGRQLVVTQQDDDLRSRFSRWWLQQDPKAILGQSGGFRDTIPWEDLRPWTLLGFVPLCFGFIWSIVLLNLPRRRLPIAFPVVIIWSLLGLLVMLLKIPHIPANSPFAASMMLIMPMLLPVLAVYFGGLLLVGLLVGRTLARGFVRLALPPASCSRFAQLWLADGKAPPRVMRLPHLNFREFLPPRQ